MKTNRLILTACLASAILSAPATLCGQVVQEAKDLAKNPPEIKAEVKVNGGDAKTEAHAKADPKTGANNTTSHAESKSVSVTSDGSKTIRKTTTTRNGITEEKTEVLDQDGNVVEGDDNQEPSKPEGTAKPGGVWIGAEVKAADPALRDQLGLGPDEGVVIRTLAAQGPAEKAGLKVNDILLKAGEQVLAEPEDLRSELRNLKAGDTLAIEYLRKGQRGSATVTVEERGSRQQQGDQPNKQNRDGGSTLELKIDGATDIEKILEDPNIPETVKKQMRDMLEKMKNLPK
ncbi:MAG: PDZ domain-containing protein [Verrucomicrobia bacterium]|nr:PDZ domain-containing protein [Verrucomicrobiota bacterium]